MSRTFRQLFSEGPTFPARREGETDAQYAYRLEQSNRRFNDLRWAFEARRIEITLAAKRRRARVKRLLA